MSDDEENYERSPRAPSSSRRGGGGGGGGGKMGGSGGGSTFRSSNNSNNSSSNNLSNKDFRRMVLETPRRGGGGSGGGGGNSEHRDRDKHRQRKEYRSDQGGEDGDKKKKSWGKGKGEGGGGGPKASGGTGSGGEGEDDGSLKYRDRAKERREDQNPDYKDIDAVAERMGTLNAVAPPGTTDITTSDAHKLAIEKSKFLGGDVEHTHLVKGLDFALLQKVRSEIDRKQKGPSAGEGEGEGEDDEGAGEEQGAMLPPAAAVKPKIKGKSPLDSASFRTAIGKSVYELLVRPPVPKANEFFLPGRTSFVFDMDDEFRNEMPTTVHRSKADCPPPEDLVTIAADGAVLDRITHIMAYLRLGASAKAHKKRKEKKDKDHVLVPGLVPATSAAAVDGQQQRGDDNLVWGAPSILTREQAEAMEAPLVPPPPAPQSTASNQSTAPAAMSAAAGRGKDRGEEEEEEDIFAGAGKDYVPTVPSRRGENGAMSGDGIEGEGAHVGEGGREDGAGGAVRFAEPSGVLEPWGNPVLTSAGEGTAGGQLAPPPPPPPDDDEEGGASAPPPPPPPPSEAYEGAYPPPPVAGPAYPPPDATWSEYPAPPPPPPDDGAAWYDSAAVAVGAAGPSHAHAYPPPPIPSMPYPGDPYAPSLPSPIPGPYPPPAPPHPSLTPGYNPAAAAAAYEAQAAWAQQQHQQQQQQQQQAAAIAAATAAAAVAAAAAGLPLGVSSGEYMAGGQFGQADSLRGAGLGKFPGLLTQEEKERGLGSVFKRFDEAEEAEKRRKAAVDEREKDPAYVSTSYAECYPDYKEGYAGHVVESDDEEDLTQMDAGSKTKKGLHRWDFQTDEEWEAYKSSKEIVPTEAFQYGIKAADGRKSKKAMKDKEQKLSNELNQINKIIDRRRREKGGGGGGGGGGVAMDEFGDDVYPSKKVRL